MEASAGLVAGSHNRNELVVICRDGDPRVRPRSSHVASPYSSARYRTSQCCCSPLFSGEVLGLFTLFNSFLVELSCVLSKKLYAFFPSNIRLLISYSPISISCAWHIRLEFSTEIDMSSMVLEQLMGGELYPGLMCSLIGAPATLVVQSSITRHLFASTMSQLRTCSLPRAAIYGVSTRKFGGIYLHLQCRNLAHVHWQELQPTALQTRKFGESIVVKECAED